MIKLGILGSVGSGKSFVSNIFKELKFDIFSADEVVSEIYKNNKAINKKISKFFKIKLYKNRIDKQELREILKKAPKKFKFLNKIFHPLVREKLNKFLLLNKKKRLVVLDIPLLLEGELHKLVDIFVFIKTRSKLLNNRIGHRKNLDRSFLKTLKKQQIDENYKEKKADFIIHNNAKRKVKLQIKNILDKILLNND
jgi:dephospho-CoA kinase